MNPFSCDKQKDTAHPWKRLKDGWQPGIDGQNPSAFHRGRWGFQPQEDMLPMSNRIYLVTDRETGYPVYRVEGLR